MQTKEKFDMCGLHSSIIMAGYETDFTAPVMIVTHQSYTRRLKLDSVEANRFFHDADMIIVDECNLGISPSYLKIYKYYENKIIIGLTGTPARGDQRGLGEVFDDLVESIGIKELTEKGFLTPARYFAPVKIDLSDVGMIGGDYNKKQLQKKLNTKTLNGDILESWLKHAEGRQTLIFTSGVAHSRALQGQFERHGITIAHLDAHSEDDERSYVLDKFRSGEITVVTNCALFTEGYDADFVSCIVLARSTASLPLYFQMCGRGQRLYPEKQDFIILDHGSNIEKHGLISDDILWSLDGKTKAWKKPKKKEKEKKYMNCTMCGAVFEAADKCPVCFYPAKLCGRLMECNNEELKELGKQKAKKTYTMDEKRKWYGMLELVRIEKGYKPGWSANQYKSRFGVFPRGMDDVIAASPTKEFTNYLTWQRIKFFKSKKAQEA